MDFEVHIEVKEVLMRINLISLIFDFTKKYEQLSTCIGKKIDSNMQNISKMY